MSTAEEAYARHRMDRSLDEIAAEMNSSSQLNHGSNSLPFGQDYEERDYIGAPIRGVPSSSSKRHTPYSTSRSSYRDRGSRDRDASPMSRSNRLFVANLSYHTTWQTLKDHMRKAAPILKCDIFRDPGGHSRGMGLAVYEDEKGAEAALRMLNSTEVDGRKIYLRKDLDHREREKSGMSSYPGRGKPLPNPDATVFVGNLDYSVTWQKLKDVFKVAGKVLNADILMDASGKSKGMGEVQFEDQADAVNGIALFHGQMLCDRPMTVRMDCRSNFQPDPLQLKLSSLSNAGGLGSDLSSYRRRTDSIYDHKVSPPHFSGGRDELFGSRRQSAYGRRGYSPPLRHGVDMASSIFSRGRGSPPGTHRGGGWRESEYEDRKVGILSRSGTGTGEGNCKLFVRNLSYSTSWQHLKDTFRRAGGVQHVDILEGPDGRSKGCAVVWLDTPEGARKAIDMFNDFEVDGRKLEVRYDRR